MFPLPTLPKAQGPCSKIIIAFSRITILYPLAATRTKDRAIHLLSGPFPTFPLFADSPWRLTGLDQELHLEPVDGWGAASNVSYDVTRQEGVEDLHTVVGPLQVASSVELSADQQDAHNPWAKCIRISK